MTEFTKEAEAWFRKEIADFVDRSLDEEGRRQVELGKSLSRNGFVEWQRKLVAMGWGAPHWPKEWGGTDWSLRQRFVFDEEMALQGAPHMVGFNTRMLGPILLTYGTDAQKERFLPRALTFKDWWCQGYSEPSSGSDLASLQTRAVREGNSYVVNGSKIWTTYGHYANWMFCLVRTDPNVKKQEGISFLLIDMNSPGLLVQPVKHFYGQHVFNQIFFDDVRVPAENLVGKENEGWTIAKALLEHERLATSRHSEARRKLGRLIRMAKQTRYDDKTMLEDSYFRQRIAQLAINVRAVEYSTMRALEKYIDDGEVGFFASSLKLCGVAVNQSVDEAILDLLGPGSLPADSAYNGDIPVTGLVADAQFATEARYYMRGPAIAGGSNEVQRAIISKQVLKL